MEDLEARVGSQDNISGARILIESLNFPPNEIKIKRLEHNLTRTNISLLHAFLYLIGLDRDKECGGIPSYESNKIEDFYKRLSDLNNKNLMKELTRFSKNYGGFTYSEITTDKFAIRQHNELFAQFLYPNDKDIIEEKTLKQIEDDWKMNHKNHDEYLELERAKGTKEEDSPNFKKYCEDQISYHLNTHYTTENLRLPHFIYFDGFQLGWAEFPSEDLLANEKKTIKEFTEILRDCLLSVKDDEQRKYKVNPDSVGYIAQKPKILGNNQRS